MNITIGQSWKENVPETPSAEEQDLARRVAFELRMFGDQQYPIMLNVAGAVSLVDYLIKGLASDTDPMAEAAQLMRGFVTSLIDSFAIQKAIYEALKANFPLMTCKKCGCNDFAACEGGCSWAEKDYCSSCKEKELIIVKFPERRDHH